MVYTHKNSLGTDEQTKEQRFEALNRNHILNVYFQNLREEIPSFLKQQNSKHRLVHNDERQDTNLINIPAHLPMQFIA